MGGLDFAFPNRPVEPDLLCTLTCFHIVGIGRVPQPLQSCEERKRVLVKNKIKQNSHDEADGGWLPS